MKKFLNAHYEKIILAVLLIAFAALLYYQLQFVQTAQNQDIDDIVNQKQPNTDYEPIDFGARKEYKMETIFSEWNKVEPGEVSATATQMMAPYPMAECVFCHALIPSNAYPAIGETKNGKCPACGKALAPRIKVEIDALGRNDANSNSIPDDWEKEMHVSDEYSSPESDEDSDGFNLQQEYKAKTNPTDPLSHPKYITQMYSSAVSQKRFTGLELVSVDDTKEDKKDWTATFNVIRNDKKRTEFVRINVGTFNHQDGRTNVAFTLLDIEMDDKTQEYVAYIQRVGKQDERIVCRIKQPVYDPMPRVRLLNALYNRTITSSVGSSFKLGTAKTGEEQYNIISADPVTKEILVESVGETPETFKLLPAPKDTSASNAAGTAQAGASSTNTKNDAAPFLQRQ